MFRLTRLISNHLDLYQILLLLLISATHFMAQSFQEPWLQPTCPCWCGRLQQSPPMP